MSAHNEIRMLPNANKMPLEAIKKIFSYVSSTRDRSICRQVCFNWLHVIDVIVGLGLKLTRANKANMFKSNLLRSCTSLKIHESAGLSNWYVCYFSPINLKSVEIVGNILSDNWRLLLDSCKSIQLLTITVHILTFNRHQQVFEISNKTFNFPAEFSGDKIDHPCLRRIAFKNIYPHDPHTEADASSIAHILNTLGIIPQLRQIIFISLVLHFYPDNSLPMKDALLSLMQRNPGINSVGFTFARTHYSEMCIWDRFLQENKSCLVQSKGFYVEWQEIFDRLLMVETLYYGIYNETQLIGFQTLIANIVRVSRNLTKLFLVLGGYKDDFDCALLVKGMKNLIELSLCNYQYRTRKQRPSHPRLLNLNILTNRNIGIQYLYISLTLSEANFDAIFSIPQLQELHIKYQDSATEFNKRHVEMVINHNHLKLIFWEKSLQKKWNLFSTECSSENWIVVQLNQKAPTARRVLLQRMSRIHYVEIPDEGLIAEKRWKKKFADNFAVFNEQRLEADDWSRIIDLSM